jgi:hypothetical protein
MVGTFFSIVLHERSFNTLISTYAFKVDIDNVNAINILKDRSIPMD